MSLPTSCCFSPLTKWIARSLSNKIILRHTTNSISNMIRKSSLFLVKSLYSLHSWTSISLSKSQVREPQNFTVYRYYGNKWASVQTPPNTQVWRPHNLKGINLLEQIQRRGSKYILNDFILTVDQDWFLFTYLHWCTHTSYSSFTTNLEMV